MTFKSKAEIDRILAALGDQLAASGSEPLDLLVCGGSALHALHLVTRTTKDVDVVARIEGGDGKMRRPDPFSPALAGAIAKVARDFRLKDDWFNPGPASALDFGLPAGVLERAEVAHYGTHLTVRFFSRYDQIHFKLYAAVDQGGKHYADLVELKPTAEELLVAARWSMTHDVSETYKDEVKKILRGMGHNDVAERI
ncbi:MAG TPA: hypothetical protein PKK31_06065 [Elusimicrobiales bacterium]|nr:hypothetical protein [Elusimicrobiales bacterium]